MERETEAGAASLLPAETETSPQKNGKDEDDESGWEAGNFSDDESNGTWHNHTLCACLLRSRQLQRCVDILNI